MDLMGLCSETSHIASFSLCVFIKLWCFCFSLGGVLEEGSVVPLVICCSRVVLDGLSHDPPRPGCPWSRRNSFFSPLFSVTARPLCMDRPRLEQGRGPSRLFQFNRPTVFWGQGILWKIGACSELFQYPDLPPIWKVEYNGLCQSEILVWYLIIRVKEQLVLKEVRALISLKTQLHQPLIMGLSK